MYSLANNVLGRLKYDITGAAVTLVVEPLAGTAFNLPPAPTSSGGGTYGKPWSIVTLIDRLDSSAAKIEHVLYNARAAELAGAYTLSGAVRGQENTAAQAWVAGAYVIQQATDEVLAQKTPMAVMRAEQVLVHARDAVMTWDGTSFKFTNFQVSAIGRGKHWNGGGIQTISMPANTTVVTGFGGAANQAVAAGAIPIPAMHSLWYEPDISSAAAASIAGNFRLVATTADFVVPPHWIFLAVHDQVATAGEKILRVANGVTLYPWRVIGAAGEPAFTNLWVNEGTDAAKYLKDAAGWVHVRGIIKSGTIALAAFTLPAGYRPTSAQFFPGVDNGAFCTLKVSSIGEVIVQTGSGAVYVSLDGIRFMAEQ